MKIKISEIKTGTRFRKDVGDLSLLVESIERVGLLHPIVVTENNELICGKRRIEAYKKLNLTKIEATIVSLLDSNLDEAEADENIVRKKFTTEEMIEIDQVLRKKEETSARERQRTGRPVRNLSKGRSSAKIAARLDISPSQLDKIRYVHESAVKNPVAYSKTWDLVGNGRIKPDKGYNYIKRLEKIESAKKNVNSFRSKNIPNRNSLFDLKLGLMQKKGKEISPNSVELIFTDPPYNEENLSLYGDLAKLAQRVLQPGGSLITIIGHYALFKIGKLIEENSELKYHWIFCIKHTGNTGKLWDKRVWPKWKPALWYYKLGGPDSNNTTGSLPTMYTDVEDFIISQPADKIIHEWEQSTIEADHVIKALTVEGQTVCDPFMGSGAFGEAANKLLRKFIGIEADKEVYSMAAQRLAQVNTGTSGNACDGNTS
jgi:ParB family chromosome partitioning protein